MFVADVQVARSLLQARVQQRIVEQIVDVRVPPLQEHLSRQREVRNVDVVTPQLVKMVVYLTVTQVPLPDVLKKLIENSKHRLQLCTSGCSAALNFSRPQIDEETVEPTVFLIMSSARRRRHGGESPGDNFRALHREPRGCQILSRAMPNAMRLL